MIGTPTLASALAGSDAERQADRRLRGRPSKCPRNRYRHPIAPAVCVADYRAGMPECMRDCGCSVGRVLDATFPKEDNSMTYGKCTRCGRTGNLNADGLCYYAKCKKEREAKCETSSASADPLEMRESPIRDDEDSADGRTAATPMLDAIQAPPPPVTVEQVSDSTLPEDMDRPFVLAGIEFEPVTRQRVVGKDLVTIREKAVFFLSGAVARHNLGQYSHARLTVSVDGKALAVKFYSDVHEGAGKLQGKRGVLSLSATAFLRAHRGIVGQSAALEPAGVGGWFVVRFGHGEAA